MSKDILRNKKLLIRFTRQIFLAPDTPAVIQVVASDAAYMVLTQTILHMEFPKNLPFFRHLTDFYYRQGLNWLCLCEKLKPAAHALGLSPENSEPLDYYQLLGVTPAATESEIKKAYRIRAHATHPDTSSTGNLSTSGFIQIQVAYQTLSNPALRTEYDRSRIYLERWFELPPGSDKKSTTRTRFRDERRHIYQLTLIILLLFLAALFLDFIYW
jgi:hypothetical protein